MENVIESDRLTVSLSGTKILSNLSFSVPPSTVCALLGPNGAGKTTLIRTLMNIYAPSSGAVKVLGTHSTQLRPKHFQTIGFVSESQEVPTWMTVQSFFDYCAEMYPNWRTGWLEDKRSELGLPVHALLRDLSRGMLIKVKLLSSLAFEPTLLVLDEPFSGLDPVVRDEFVQLVMNLCEESRATVFISSHDLSEVERMSDSILFLKGGEVRTHASLDDLLKRFRAVQISFDSSSPLPRELPKSWKRIEIGERAAHFVHTDFENALVHEELKSIHASATITQVSELPLGEIYRVIMKETVWSK
jgi:ABC-2 type transport system ATP-binding protein